MPKLRPISAPFERRWREFRIQHLPVLAFTMAVCSAAFLWREFAMPHQAIDSVAPPAAVQIDPPQPPHSSIATFTPVSLNRASITNPPPAFSD
jgi:hypothetical protein